MFWGLIQRIKWKTNQNIDLVILKKTQKLKIKATTGRKKRRKIVFSSF